MRILKNILFLLLFLIFGFWLLMDTFQSYLLETGALTPYFTTSWFYKEMMARPAGPVYYVASMLQSCFALPWLGTSLLLVLLTVLAYAVKGTFRMKGAWQALCFLPSLLLLLNYTSAGYMIYLVKMPALAFTPIVGMLCAVFYAWIFRYFDSHPSRLLHIVAILLIMLLTTVGIWVMGVYALFSFILCMIFSLIQPKSHHLHTVQVGFVASWLGILAYPLPHILTSLLHVRVETIFMAGIPEYLWNEQERYLLYPLLTAMFICVVLAFITNKKKLEVADKWPWDYALGLLILLAGMWVTFTNSFRDRNFLCILEMKQAIERNDNERVLQLAMQNEEVPTRLQVMMTRLALWRTGQAGDKLFNYPDGDAPYNAPRTFQYQRLIAGRLLYYYFGKINYAYRWCMEDMVEYGRRPDYLKYMTKCAMLNNEPQLARKYTEQLRNTFFYKDFADEYNNLMMAHQTDNDMKQIQPLMQYNDILDGDAGMIELYILNSLAYSEGGSRELIDMSLMCNLITKNLRGFWPRFMQLLPTWNGKIPVHYQEAALMIAQLQGGIDISKLPFSNNVKARFQQLVEASSENGDNQQNASLLKPGFGDTYWYYYFFVEGMKTN